MRNLLYCAFALLGVHRAQDATDVPTAAQRAAIDRGESVMVTRSLPDLPWPEVTVFRFIEASPEEAVAVFVDYGLHKSYLPRVKQSAVSRVIDFATIEVDYTVEVPFLSDEKYTVRNRLSRDGAEGFRVEWTLVRASSTKFAHGYARFLRYQNARSGRSGALLEYRNLVVPGSRFARLGFIAKRAIRQVEETTRAIGDQVVVQRKLERTMGERIARLQSSLAQTTPPPLLK